MASNSDFGNRIAQFEKRRPSPGDLSNVQVPSPMNRERPVPGDLSSQRSISSSPSQRAPSPLSFRKLGTPEGGSYNSQRSFGSGKLSATPGDMSNHAKRRSPSPGGMGMGLSMMSPKIRPPSPGVGKMGKPSPRIRPPSPGMGMMSPPSTGMGPALGALSTKNNGVNRGMPSPGRQRRSPSPSDFNAQPQKQGTPEIQDSSRFESPKRHPSTPSNENESKHVEKGKELEKQKSVTFSKSLSKQRFVFTNKPTGVLPPSKISVSTVAPSGDAINTMETPPSSPLKPIGIPENNNIAKLSPRRKDNNPLRNNPLFLQKLAASMDSDSDEDEELQKVNANAQERRNPSPVQKMKKIAELSSAQDLSPAPKKINLAMNSTTPTNEEQKPLDNDFDSPVKFVDGPEQPILIIEPEPKENPNALNNNAASSHWKQVPKSPKRIGLLAQKLKRTRDAKAVQSSQPSLVVADEKQVAEPAPSLPVILNPLAKKLEELEISPSLSDTVSFLSENIDTGEQSEQLMSPTSMEIISPIKSDPPSPERVQPVAETKGHRMARLQKAKNRFPQQSASAASLKSNNPNVETVVEEVDTKSDLNKGKRKKMTIGEKLNENSRNEAELQPSDSSVSSNGNKSMASFRSRIDRAKGRISASSASPSPNLTKHMPSSSSLKNSHAPRSRSAAIKKIAEARESTSIRTPSERKKSVMRKMVEAREKRSSNLSLKKTISSEKFEFNKPNPRAMKQTTKSAETLRSYPSLISAPSDEHGLAIAPSTSSEHLSVKKGLNLLKEQNVAMKNYRHLPKESNTVSGSQDKSKEKTRSRSLSDNVTRLRMLKEHQKRRSQRKEDDEYTIHDKPELKSTSFEGHRDERFEIEASLERRRNGRSQLRSASLERRRHGRSELKSASMERRRNGRSEPKTASPEGKRNARSVLKAVSLEGRGNRRLSSKNRFYDDDYHGIEDIEYMEDAEDVDNISYSEATDNIEDDDDFSIDDFPIASPTPLHQPKIEPIFEELDEPSPSSTLLNSPHNPRRSRATSIHQNGGASKSEKGGWGTPQHKQSQAEKGWNGDKNQSTSTNNEADPQSMEPRWNGQDQPWRIHDTQHGTLLNSGPRNVSFQVEQPYGVEQSPILERRGENEEQHADIYVGAYSELLPRSTNPLLVRICEPTLPSTLINTYTQYLPIKIHTDMPMAVTSKEIASEQHASPITENKPVSRNEHIVTIEEQNSPTNDKIAEKKPDQVNQLMHSSALPGRSDITQYSQPATSPKSTQGFSPPKGFEREPIHNQFLTPEATEGSKDDSQWSSFQPENPNDAYYAPAHNLVEASAVNVNATHSLDLDDESLFESTLVGQVHVTSMDESTRAENDESESVADWWQKTYAHTQNDEVNSDVKNALSQTNESIKLKNQEDEDSDDDVFHGLNDSESPAKNRSPKIKKKHNRSTNLRRGLQTIMSEDSEFDEIMNGDSGLSLNGGSKDKSPTNKKGSLPPPPPPVSTPPNKQSSSKPTGKTPLRNIIVTGKSKKDEFSTITEKNNNPLKDNSNGAKQAKVHKGQSFESRENTIQGKSPHGSSPGSRTYGDSTFDNTLDNGTGTFDNGTYDTGTYDTGTYDTGTHGNGTYDDHSYSSRSTRSDGSYTFGSATVESMALNDRERKKWDDWDKKDHNSEYTGGSNYASEHTMDTRQRNAILERRARAHEQLLMHAYTALSKPAPPSTSERGTSSDRLPQLLGSGSSQYQSDAENKAPVKSSQPSSRTILKQRQLLERFCVKIKNTPFEVLKLNRDSKWQTRYLTVSKEGSWLKNGSSLEGDACFCPLALLWVKKLTSTNDHSVTSIDKQGRGGIIFAHLSNVKVEKELAKLFPLTKRQNDKFRDSIVLRIHSDGGGKSTATTLRCTRGAAENIVLGCSAIIDVLRGHSSRKKSGGSSSQQYATKQQSSSDMYTNSQMTHNKKEYLSAKNSLSSEDNAIVIARSHADEGAPNLWEA